MQIRRTHRIPRGQRLFHLSQQGTEVIAGSVDRRTLVADKEADRTAGRNIELFLLDREGAGAAARHVVYVVIVGLRRSSEGERDRGEPGEARAAHYFTPPCAARVAAMRDRNALNFMVSVLSFTGREVSGSSISSRLADRVAMRSVALSPATENSPCVRPVIQVIPLLLVHRKNTNSSPWIQHRRTRETLVESFDRAARSHDFHRTAGWRP